LNITDRQKEIFWKTTLICFGLIALSSGLFKISKFWSGYALDMAGPAWIYMLIRGQYNSKKRFLNIKFSPEIAFALVLVLCFAIEIMQFFEIYNATYDPYDYLAYFSATSLIYLTDKMLNSKRRTSERKKNGL